MLKRWPYLDGVLWTDGLNPKISGPFENQTDLNLAIIEKPRQTKSDPYIRSFQYDLSDSQRPQIRIKLLDWKIAG